MSRETITTPLTRDELRDAVRQLPGILSGRLPDRHGLASGFRARIAWVFYSLVARDFVKKARGGTGEDGEKWAPLSQKYLAYQRPTTDRQRPRHGGKFPGGKDGMLNDEELTRWRKIYARNLAWLVANNDLKTAKGIAAAIATKTLREEGAEFKIDHPSYGGRQVGDYMILKSEGNLLRSIQPGEIAGENYRTPKDDQLYESEPTRLVVGTKTPYAAAHHHGKRTKQRRLWPSTLPARWLREITAQAKTGIGQIGRLIGRGQL